MYASINHSAEFIKLCVYRTAFYSLTNLVDRNIRLSKSLDSLFLFGFPCSAFYLLRLQEVSNRIVISLVAGALLYQLNLIIKFTPLYPVDAPAAKKTEDAFSVIQVNVEMSNRQTQKLKELILRHQPDIISINEPDEWWANELNVFDGLYPYSIKKPKSNTYGMILLSKFPLKNKEINFLVDKDIPSFFTTVVLASGKKFNFVACILNRHNRAHQPMTVTQQF
jgi:endonuclease/exonuclease/phosphatase (EEP) superfamily protein YafD